MPPRVTQTIQETEEFTDEGQAGQVSRSSQERLVETQSGASGTGVREGQLERNVRAAEVNLGRAATFGDFLALGTWMQNMVNLQQQQLMLLQSLNNRLDRLDTYAGSYAAGTPVERATWWALWGLLMLILGGVLVIIILLILTQNLGIAG